MKVVNSVMVVLFSAILFGMTGCGGGGGGGTATTPVATVDAGPAQNVVVGRVVTLNGVQSTAPAGTLITYHWSFISKPDGSACTISNPTNINPTIVTDLPGQYILKLMITDGATITTEDTVTITALDPNVNIAPVANAGSSQSVVAGTVVTLDGSGCTDANGDALTFSWSFTSKPSGSTAVLSNATAVKPTFTADVAGTYALHLDVNDGKGGSNGASVTVTASVANVGPVASAGVSRSVVTGTVVTLDGTGSSDANGDQLTYNWSFTSKPSGSNATLSSLTAAKPTFTPDMVGSYVLKLVVSDGQVSSAANTVTITVLAPEPVNNSNYDKTYMLKGVWTFVYTILSTWTDSYVLDTMNPTPNASGTYYISGSGLNGQGAVLGGYDVPTGYWGILDPGSIIDQYYFFKTNGTNVLSGGCYYQITKSGTWSACYPLYGTKSNLSNTPVAMVATKSAKIAVEAAKATQQVAPTIPDAQAEKVYRELKSGAQLPQ